MTDYIIQIYSKCDDEESQGVDSTEIRCRLRAGELNPYGESLLNRHSEMRRVGVHV